MSDDVKAPRIMDSLARAPKVGVGDERSAIQSGVILQLRGSIEAAQAQSQVLKPLRERGGYVEYPLDIAGLITAGLRVIDLPFFGVVVAQQGTTPGVQLDFDFKGGGRKRTVLPGAVFRGYTDALVVRPAAANAVTAGTVVLLLLTQPDAVYEELPGAAGIGYLVNSTTLGPAGAATQAYNAASGGVNIPTAASDGVSLAGVKGFRASLELASSTITAGSMRWWQYSVSAWRPTDTVYTLDNDPLNIGWSGPDELCSVPVGRIYPEFYGVTATAGAPLLTPIIETWG